MLTQHSELLAGYFALPGHVLPLVPMLSEDYNTGILFSPLTLRHLLVLSSREKEATL